MVVPVAESSIMAVRETKRASYFLLYCLGAKHQSSMAHACGQTQDFSVLVNVHTHAPAGVLPPCLLPAACLCPSSCACSHLSICTCLYYFSLRLLVFSCLSVSVQASVVPWVVGLVGVLFFLRHRANLHALVLAKEDALQVRGSGAMSSWGP